MIMQRFDATDLYPSIAIEFVYLSALDISNGILHQAVMNFLLK